MDKLGIRAWQMTGANKHVWSLTRFRASLQTFLWAPRRHRSVLGEGTEEAGEDFPRGHEVDLEG